MWCNFEACNSVPTLCQHYEEDLGAAKEAANTYPGSVLIAKYEEIVSSPNITIPVIFEVSFFQRHYVESFLLTVVFSSSIFPGIPGLTALYQTTWWGRRGTVRALTSTRRPNCLGQWPANGERGWDGQSWRNWGHSAMRASNIIRCCPWLTSSLFIICTSKEIQLKIFTVCSQSYWGLTKSTI